MSVSSSSVVLVLKTSTNLTLPIKTLRAAVAQELGTSDLEAAKALLSPVIDQLVAEGRAKMEGKLVILLEKEGGDVARNGGGEKKQDVTHKAEEEDANDSGVVGFLKASPNLTLPIKTLRASVAKALGQDAESVKESLKPVIEHLIEIGRVKMEGKLVVLQPASAAATQGGATTKDVDNEEEDEYNSGVVRLLKASPNLTLPIKTLRAFVAKALGHDVEVVKENLKPVIEKLVKVGRVKMEGKLVILQAVSAAGFDSSKKRKADDAGAESGAVAGRPAKVAAAADPNAWLEPAPSTDTRVFLGNLHFKIDDLSLKKAIGGITHVKFVTDKETQKFYGSAFIECATPADAKACVALSGTKILGRPLKANLAPPRPGDVWPPVEGGLAYKDKPGFEGGSAANIREPQPKPFHECRNLFLGNLAYSIDDDALKEFFKKCGEVEKIRWLTHQDSGDFKGCGYVTFWEPSAADVAVKLNGQPLLGRPVRIDWDAGGKF
jgi:nucleolin